MRSLSIIGLLIAGLCQADDSDWGDLTIRFVYDGETPTPARIAEKLGDQFCGDLSLVDESLIVNPVNHGITNVVVYAYEGLGGRRLPALHPDATSVAGAAELSSINCNYQPRIVAMKAGDQLSIINTDTIGCNATLGFLRNADRTFLLPPKSKTVLTPSQPEPAPIPVASVIYPWMHARVLVLEHRYCGISDENGVLRISNLPTGVPLSFRIYHERADLRTLQIGDTQVDRRSLFECKLKGGKNDLGVVAIDSSRFSD